MKLSEITNLTLISTMENATELFKAKKYQSKEYVEAFIGLAIHKSGFYGLYEPSIDFVTPLPRNKTVFDSEEDVTLIIEGSVALPSLPVNIGSGSITRIGEGTLSVDGVVVSEGSPMDPALRAPFAPSLVSDGYMYQYNSSNSDIAVSALSIPSDLGDIMVVRSQFTIAETGGYVITTGGSKGLLIGTLGGKLVVGFFGTGRFTTSIGDFSVFVNGQPFEMRYSRSTGAISIEIAGVPLPLAADTVTPVSRFFDNKSIGIGGRVGVGDYVTGGCKYLNIEVDGVEMFDYTINEGSGTVIENKAGDFDLVLSGSTPVADSWAKNYLPRTNAINILKGGQSNDIVRNTETEDRPLDLPEDGKLPSGAYFTGNTWSEFGLEMNIQGDNVGGYGSAYRLCDSIWKSFGKNTNITQYAQGGTSMGTNAGNGKWNYVTGNLVNEFIEVANKSGVEYDIIIYTQGGSDASDGTDAGNYEANERGLVNRLRSEVRGGANALIIIVRLFDFTHASYTEIATIQTAQDAVAASEPNVVVMRPPNNVTIKADGLHFDGVGADIVAKDLFKIIQRYYN